MNLQSAITKTQPLHQLQVVAGDWLAATEQDVFQLMKSKLFGFGFGSGTGSATSRGECFPRERFSLSGCTMRCEFQRRAVAPLGNRQLDVLFQALEVHNQVSVFVALVFQAILAGRR